MKVEATVTVRGIGSDQVNSWVPRTLSCMTTIGTSTNPIRDQCQRRHPGHQVELGETVELRSQVEAVHQRRPDTENELAEEQGDEHLTLASQVEAEHHEVGGQPVTGATANLESIDRGCSHLRLPSIQPVNANAASVHTVITAYAIPTSSPVTTPSESLITTPIG